jgi:hypothetical protein
MILIVFIRNPSRRLASSEAFGFPRQPVVPG